MDYEKKYKESMAKMSTFLAKHDGFTISKDGEMYKELSEIFPELKESEDEVMRKKLLELVAKHCGKTCEMYLWLEKQGEREPVVVIPKFRVGDVIRPKGSTAEYTIESISGECYHGKGWGLHISGDDDYELVEQKPAWSEEDEDAIGMAIIALEDMYDEDAPNTTYGGYNLPFNKAAKRLKALRERYTWKPSDEQIKALANALSLAKNCGEESAFDLRTLYEQIKKLREE